MKKGFFVSLTALLLMAPTALWAITVSYDIGPYASGGYSASWAHSAGGSPAASDLDLNGDGSNDTLYMSPGRRGRKIALTGTLTGDWDGAILSNITGLLNDTEVTGGSLGGAYYTGDLAPLWYLDVAGAGTFYFEEINSMINQITRDYLLLWGQNEAAYGVTRGKRWGLDLYGRGTALAEPGTLLLMALGLISMAVVSRRRERLAASKL